MANPKKVREGAFEVVIVDQFQGHDEYGYDTHGYFERLKDAIAEARRITEEGIKESGSLKKWDGMGVAGLVYDSTGALVWDGVREYRPKGE